ncbi:MAG: single-stranded DNA-binding protein [Candidatus Woesebacteria bacterium]|nr:single-stranded DNA-binding protein [Candidatus Woesebacteria bacterium]
MAKSLNKVQLIGNTTADPELKYTPTGAAVCNFSVATNRQWTTDTGEKKDEADFHRLVAWNKLAEICGQLLKKGRKVYVEGRLSTRSWQDKDGQTKYMTEVVLSDMILLDSKPVGESMESESQEFNVPENPPADAVEVKKSKNEEKTSDDIPF